MTNEFVGDGVDVINCRGPSLPSPPLTCIPNGPARRRTGAKGGETISPSSLLQGWSWRSGAARTRPECSSWRTFATWAWRRRWVCGLGKRGGRRRAITVFGVCRDLPFPPFSLMSQWQAMPLGTATPLYCHIVPPLAVLPIAGPAPPSARIVRRQVRGVGLGAGAGSARGGYAQGKEGGGC